ncbi:MAG: Calx-beta domain-containing protein, partial [Nocardioidaceae bacterium]
MVATTFNGSAFAGWSGGCAGTASSCTVTVNADTAVTADFTRLSVVSFSAATYNVSEAGPAATITVIRSGGTHAGVSVEVVTSDGTARAGADYVAVSQSVTFGAGQMSRSITVPVSNGTVADGNKTVNLALRNPQGLAVLGLRTTAVLTIVDNDAPGTFQFSAAGYSVFERADVPVTGFVRVTRTGGAASGITVDLATSDGTARAGSDYTSITQTLTFAAGETVKDVAITILPDTLVEGNETVGVTLSNPGGGAKLGALQRATLTILDAQVGVQFGAPVYRVSEGAASATISVVRTGPTTGTTTVVYSTADGTATAGADYLATAGVLTFGPGATTRTFSVPLRNDTVVDGVKTALVMLGAVSGGARGPQSTAVLTIEDNDAGGAFRFSGPTYSVSGGAAVATITVVRTGGLASGVTIDFATSDGTATAGQTYAATAGTLAFGAGETRRTFTVPLPGDAVVEGSRTVNLTLSNPTGGATLGTPATAVLTVVEDDAGGALRFSAASYSVTEGGTATITVLRTGGAAAEVTVNFATIDGTAVAGVDYTTTTGSLAFGAGETSKTFTVATSANAVTGPNRSLRLALSAPGGGAVLGTPATAQLTLIDATTSVEFSAATYTMSEARPSVTVTVVRSGPTAGTVSVRYAIADGTATAGEDYTGLPGLLTFTPGVTTRTFTVAIRADAVREPDETILVMLEPPTGAVLGVQRTAQVVILDDDAPGALQFSAPAYQVAEGGTTTITVVRTGGTGGTVTIPYTVAAGTAAAGVDYVPTSGMLTFGPGVASRAFTIQTLGDSLIEPNESVVVSLG